MKLETMNENSYVKNNFESTFYIDIYNFLLLLFDNPFLFVFLYLNSEKKNITNYKCFNFGFLGT